MKLLLLHLVGVPYYFTYSDDARSNTNQVYMKMCPHTDIKIGNVNVKGVIDTGFEISLVTEDICKFIVARIRDVRVKTAEHGACNRDWQ
jgi:adenosine deaminase